MHATFSSPMSQTQNNDGPTTVARCTHCNKSFSTRYSTNRHIKSVHPGLQLLTPKPGSPRTLSNARQYIKRKQTIQKRKEEVSKIYIRQFQATRKVPILNCGLTVDTRQQQSGNEEPDIDSDYIYINGDWYKVGESLYCVRKEGMGTYSP